MYTYRMAALAACAVWLGACGSSDAPSPSPRPQAAPESPAAPSSSPGEAATADETPTATTEADAEPQKTSETPTAPGPLVETESHKRMVRVLADIAAKIDENNTHQGEGLANWHRERVAKLSDDVSGMEAFVAKLLAANFELRTGHADRARDLIQSGLEGLGNDDEERINLMRNKGMFQLAVAYLRTGEIDNCCARETPDSCIVPIRGGGLHDDPRGSSGAIENLTKVLERVGPDDILYWESIWLINIAYMTLNQWPEGVPKKYLLPESVFSSELAFPKFDSIGSALGVNRMSLGGGAIADDFNGDGTIDLMVCDRHPASPMEIYFNRGKDGFEKRGKESGLAGMLGGANMVQADYDNDGDVDVYVLRGAWLAKEGKVPNSLLQNQGDGRFLDVTFDAGLATPFLPSQSAAWADYDGDGDLDLYVANETQNGSTGHSGQLYRNRGDGTFEEVARQAGVTNDEYAKGAAWGDYDADGDPDLYIGNLLRANRLYRNNGDGTFEDVAPALGVDRPQRSHLVWWWDYDSDGQLDLFSGNYQISIADLASHALGQRYRRYEPNTLFRGDGKGGFTDETEALGLARPLAPLAGNYGDLNGDGYLDFYLGTGHVMHEQLMPNRLFISNKGQGFVDATMAARMGHVQKAGGVVFADFDHDGDLDVFEQMGGHYPDDTFVDIFYRNPGFGTDWLAIDLVGKQTNRSAIGARIRVRAVVDGAERDLYRTVSSGGSAGANPLRQHFGLGKDATLKEVEIDWPVGPTPQKIENLKPGRTYRIEQGADTAKELEIESFELPDPDNPFE